jgi:hypothetical protein
MSDYGTPPPPPPPGSGSGGGYGAPPPAPEYGYGAGPMGPRDHPQGTIILILGILSLVCIQLLGPVAWVMGNKAIREIDANPGAYTNRGTVNAGRICGIIGTALLVVGVVLWVILLAAGVMSSGNS